MLNWALIFLFVAIATGVLGFGGIAGAATAIAQVLFFVFLGLFVMMLLRFGHKVMPGRVGAVDTRLREQG